MLEATIVFHITHQDQELRLVKQVRTKREAPKFYLEKAAGADAMGTTHWHVVCSSSDVYDAELLHKVFKLGEQTGFDDGVSK